jgi:hypothetical protein
VKTPGCFSFSSKIYILHFQLEISFPVEWLQVLTLMNVQITVFWDVIPLSLVARYQCFRGTCCLHLQDPEGRGSTFLRNIGTWLPEYTASHPRRTFSFLNHTIMGDFINTNYTSPHSVSQWHTITSTLLFTFRITISL